jgi:hypothetical protein
MISRITLAAIGLLLAAGEANATLVEVAFEGTVTEVTGSLPGDPSIGTSFSGTVRYDGDQPPAGFGDTVFDFADGSAALTITLAGTVYETETSAPDVVMIRQLLLVDRDDPDQPVDPSDPLTTTWFSAGFSFQSSPTSICWHSRSHPSQARCSRGNWRAEGSWRPERPPSPSLPEGPSEGRSTWQYPSPLRRSSWVAAC